MKTNLKNFIPTSHPAPETLSGISGLHRKIAALEQSNAQILKYVEQANAETSEVLSVKEVANLLGKSEKTIRRYVDREHHPLPAIKVFCNEQYSWAFKKSEVLDWFNLCQLS